MTDATELEKRLADANADTLVASMGRVSALRAVAHDAIAYARLCEDRAREMEALASRYRKANDAFQRKMLQLMGKTELTIPYPSELHAEVTECFAAQTALDAAIERASEGKSEGDE